MLAPRRDHSSASPKSSDPTRYEFAHATEVDDAFASIVDLADFERFIFVMSVLEGCSEQDVRETRVQAL